MQNKDKHRLLKNFLSLSVLQGANYILPLITLPYLVRILGPDKYGLIAFAQAFIQYFNILTDYGFSLSATREISIHRENKAKVSEIFSTVMLIKLGLLLFSFIILTLIIFSFKKFRQDWEIYYLTFGIVLGQVLFPVWFFQGMEEMKYITYFDILARGFFTVAIFIFVKQQSNYYIVPLLNSIGVIIVGIIALIVIKKSFDIKFKFQRVKIIKQYLVDGWHIFLSQINISLFSNSNTVILGILTNNTAVGYYSSAEKIMRALAMMQTPVTRSFFPFIAKEIKKDKKLALLKLKKLIIIGGILYFVIDSFFFIFAKKVIYILFGPNLEPSALVLKIIVIVPLTIFLNNIFGTQVMLNINKEKEFSRILFNGAVFNIILCFVLSYYFSYIGTAISLLIIEIYIMLAMFISVRKEFL